MNLDELNDFGFTTFSEKELVGDREKLQKMFNLIEPLLMALVKDADKNPNIHWPNREQTLNKVLEECKKLLD